MAAYDPRKHHRRSIRLDGYDYTHAGAYFVTIVTHERASLKGKCNLLAGMPRPYPRPDRRPGLWGPSSAT